MNKQWMALLLSAGMAVTTCPVPGAQEPPAEQIHTEQAEESSAAVHSDDSDREGTAADEFQSETEPSGSETETGAYEEETSENENKKDNGTMLDIQTMCSYIQKAAEAEEIDLDSEMIADFCLASDTYDSLTEDEQAGLRVLFDHPGYHPFRKSTLSLFRADARSSAKGHGWRWCHP